MRDANHVSLLPERKKVPERKKDVLHLFSLRKVNFMHRLESLCADLERASAPAYPRVARDFTLVQT
jgi:hypothetical protein